MSVYTQQIMLKAKFLKSEFGNILLRTITFLNGSYKVTTKFSLLALAWNDIASFCSSFQFHVEFCSMHINICLKWHFKWSTEVAVPISILAAPTDGLEKYEDLLASRSEVSLKRLPLS